MKKALSVLFMTATIFFVFHSSILVAEANAEGSEKVYTITFEPDNGEVAKQVMVKEGEELTEDQIPFQNLVNGNKDFLGWFNQKFNLVVPFIPQEDVTYTAKWGKNISPNPVEKPGYRLIFQDEFEHINGKLNENLWVDKYLSTWTKTPKLASPTYELKDGVMSLQIKEDTMPWAPEFDGATVVSGFTTGDRNALHNWNRNNEVRNPIATELTHINQYGYYEMRAKTQAGSSRHSAWWLLGFEDEPGQSAEIDIFEVLGNNPHSVPRAFHSWNDGIAFESDGGNDYVDMNADFHNEWHVYAMDWQEGTGSGKFPDRLVFYVDGKEVGSKNTNITYPMIQLFSLYEKREGGWTGPWEWMPYPNTFDIDYVRVYKKLPENQSELPKNQLKITKVEDSTVSVQEGQASLKTYESMVEGQEGKKYVEPNLPHTKSYVNVTWNDGVVTQEFVKWDPITEDDLARINNGEEISKNGVLPHLKNIPGLSQPTLNIEVIPAPPYTSENLGMHNSQSELAKLFDGNLESNSGEFSFASNQLPTDKEVNIQYNFKNPIELHAIDFTTNYGQDQGIRKFKLAIWDAVHNQWENLDPEYELAWTDAGNTELGETLRIEVGSLETTKIKIIITDAGLTWGNKIAMRQIEFDFDEKEMPEPEEPGIEDPEIVEPEPEEPGTENPGTEESNPEAGNTNTDSPSTVRPGAEDPHTGQLGTEKDETDKLNGEQQGKELPKTATNNYNLILSGFIAILFGIWIFTKRRKVSG